MKKEIWKPVVGYEGFAQVSNYGRVRSLDRRTKIRGGSTRQHKGRVLKQVPNNKGYPTVHLRKEGSGKTSLVHRLVLIAFRGWPQDGMEGCHNDGNPMNCRLDNLRWDTHKNNHADIKKHGRSTANKTPPIGTKNGSSKLTDECVKRVFDLRRNGANQSEIARWFGVDHKAIRNILNRKSWRHVSP